MTSDKDGNPIPTIAINQEVRAVIQAAASLMLDAATNLLQTDPHQWSTRPCSTCRTISGLVGRPFGCYLYAQQKGK